MSHVLACVATVEHAARVNRCCLDCRYALVLFDLNLKFITYPQFCFDIPGVCECNQGYIGADCTGNGPPQIIGTPNVLCDPSDANQDCSKIVLNGNFPPSQTMQCRFKRLVVCAMNV